MPVFPAEQSKRMALDAEGIGSPNGCKVKSSRCRLNLQPHSLRQGNAISRLLTLYTGNVADERIKQAAAALDWGTSNEKLGVLDKALAIPPTAKADNLGELLGEASKP